MMTGQSDGRQSLPDGDRMHGPFQKVAEESEDPLGPVAVPNWLEKAQARGLLPSSHGDLGLPLIEARDLAELERLRMTMTSSKAATVAWRELLIESLGDRMCSSGPGPTQDEIDVLASLDEAQQRASENYMMFLVSGSLKPKRRTHGGT